MRPLIISVSLLFFVVLGFSQDPIQLAVDSISYNEILDQNQSIYNQIQTVSQTVSTAQVLTCGVNGKLVRISIDAKSATNIASQITATIHEGSQPGGALLSTTTATINSLGYLYHDILFPDSIDLIAGNNYFVHIVLNGGSNLQWRKSTVNPYASGTSFINNGIWSELTNDDLTFSSYVVEEQSQSTTVLSITSDKKVRIKDYLMPAADGTTNQLLQTDGSGNVSWVNPSAGAGDDLGNHTASQDLNMSTNKIVGLDIPTNNSHAANKLYVDSHIDGDADPANELINSATLNGNNLEIIDAGGTTTVDLSPISGSSPSDEISDADDDTQILVEGNPDDDVIRMITNGVQRLQLDAHQIKPMNNGASVFIGSDAGANDDLSNNRNIMIGDSTGFNSSTGKQNVFIGHAAGANGNKVGSIMIGYRAGNSETNNNRLHIDNEDGNKNESLIYGELDNDLLRVNASFEVLTQNTIDGIKVIGHPTNNKTDLILENNNTNGQSYELFSSGGTAPIGQGKFVLRNQTQGTNNIVMDSTGRVGIGIEDPNDVLDINAAKDFEGISITGGSNNHNVQLELDNNANLGKRYVIRSTGENASQGGGKLIFRDADLGSSRMVIDGQGNVGIGIVNPTAKLHLKDEMLIEASSGTGKLELITSGNSSLFKLYNTNTEETVSLFSDYFGTGGAIRLEAAGSVNPLPILLSANYLNSGYGRIITDEIQIKGGSDLAEMFDVNGDGIQPGYVVSIDENNIGQLKITDKKYDEKIVGIISGANGIRPGMMMGQSGTIADGEQAIALSGRVFAHASNEGGNIAPGDLLTSNAKGQVIKAKRKKAGCIIGKAMSIVDEKGLVLVLISLQ